MKESMIFLGCLALLMAGCNKVEKVEVPAEEPVVESPKHLIVDFKVNQEGGTRAVKTEWTNGDKIYVFFDNFFLDYLTDPEIGTKTYSDDVEYMTLTYNGVKWNYEITPALEQYLLDQASGTLIGVYYSKLEPVFRVMHGKDSTREQFFVDVKNGANHAGFYMYDNNVGYTVANGTLTATLNMHLHERAVRFFVPGITLGADGAQHYLKSDQVTINSLSSINSAYRNGAFQPAQIGLSSVSNTLWANYVENGAEFYGRFVNSVTLGEYYDYIIQVVDQGTSSVYDDVTYAYTSREKLYGKDNIRFPELTNPYWVKKPHESEIYGILNDHHWVRMGDGRKWARWSVGGGNDDYGTMLTWAEACTAAMEWGGGWRLPTKAEWDALINARNQQARRITYVDEMGDGQEHFFGVRLTYGNYAGTFQVCEMQLLASGLWDGYQNKIIDKETGYFWTSTPVPDQDGYYYYAEVKSGNPVNDHGSMNCESRTLGNDKQKMPVRLIIDE